MINKDCVAYNGNLYLLQDVRTQKPGLLWQISVLEILAFKCTQVLRPKSKLDRVSPVNNRPSTH